VTPGADVAEDHREYAGSILKGGKAGRREGGKTRKAGKREAGKADGARGGRGKGRRSGRTVGSGAKAEGRS
jgi:hypothetical protein